MILLIDNYDSFSYNLYQYLGELKADIKVIRNDELSVDEIRALNPDKIVISPGPGRPEDAGIIIEAVKELGKDIPMLGVCLGHQAICAAFGAKITYASRLMHGKQSLTDLDTKQPIFKDCSEKTPVARYHSLVADESTLPAELKVIARADDGEVMAVRHESYPIYGLQFHPESILTPEGKKLLGNFLSVADV